MLSTPKCKTHQYLGRKRRKWICEVAVAGRQLSFNKAHKMKHNTIIYFFQRKKESCSKRHGKLIAVEGENM